MVAVFVDSLDRGDRVGVGRCARCALLHAAKSAADAAPVEQKVGSFDFVAATSGNDVRGETAKFDLHVRASSRIWQSRPNGWATINIGCAKPLRICCANRSRWT